MQKRQRRSDFGFGNDSGNKVLSSLNAGGGRTVGALAPDCLIRVDRRPVGVVKRDVEIVRVYDDPGRQRNEYRVDRLWPRGQSQGAVDHDEWVNGATPSTELRQWYGCRTEALLRAHTAPPGRAGPPSGSGSFGRRVRHDDSSSSPQRGTSSTPAQSFCATSSRVRVERRRQ